MEDSVYRVSFNVWAGSEAEANELSAAFGAFIDWFGARGIKVKAKDVTAAVNSWQGNVFIRNHIINYFNSRSNGGKQQQV